MAYNWHANIDHWEASKSLLFNQVDQLDAPHLHQELRFEENESKKAICLFVEGRRRWPAPYWAKRNTTNSDVVARWWQRCTTDRSKKVLRRGKGSDRRGCSQRRPRRWRPKRAPTSDWPRNGRWRVWKLYFTILSWLENWWGPYRRSQKAYTKLQLPIMPQQKDVFFQTLAIKATKDWSTRRSESPSPFGVLSATQSASCDSRRDEHSDVLCSARKQEQLQELLPKERPASIWDHVLAWVSL